MPFGDKIDGGKPYPQGVPLEARAVSVVIDPILNGGGGGKAAEAFIEETGYFPEIQMDLDEGEQKIRTILYDVDGKELPNGAYYVYIRKI